MARPVLLHIDGQEAPAADGATFEVRNPATGDHLYDVAHAAAADVDAAVRAASAAFDDGRWRGMRPRDRARILNRAAALLADRVDEYARLETLQIGRTLREMRAQLSACRSGSSTSAPSRPPRRAPSRTSAPTTSTWSAASRSAWPG